MSAVDLDQARRFLHLLDESAEAFSFRVLGPGRESNYHGSIDQLAGTFSRANARGDGIYVVVNAGGQRAEQITRVRAVFGDNDDPAKTPFSDCELEPHIVVGTSPGKQHAYWLVDGLGNDQFETVQKAIAAKFGTDPAVHDLPRIMRLPGFNHTKAEPYPVRILQENVALPYAAETILAAFPRASTSDEKKTAAPVASKTIPETHRNTTLASLAGTMRRRGMEPDEMVAALHKVNDNRCVPPLAAAEVEKIAQSYGHYAPADVPRSSPMTERGGRRLFTLTRADQIRLTPIAWAIRGHFATNSLAGIIGASGSGKSFIAVGMACSMATGAPWCGHGVKQGAVFYLAGEGQQGLSKRVRAWEIHTGVSIEGAPLYLSSALPFLCDEAIANEAADLIAEEVDRMAAQSGIQPVAIIIDTVARAMNGANENLTEDMGRFIKAKDLIRERWGSLVVSIHHTGHDKDKGERARGSSNYYASLDCEFLVKQTADGAVMYGTKEKDWPKPRALHFTKSSVVVIVPDEDGVALEEQVLVLHSGEVESLAANKRERALELKLSGMTVRDIAVQLQVSKTTVSDWTKEPKAA